MPCFWKKKKRPVQDSSKLQNSEATPLPAQIETTAVIDITSLGSQEITSSPQNHDSEKEFQEKTPSPQNYDSPLPHLSLNESVQSEICEENIIATQNAPVQNAFQNNIEATDNNVIATYSYEENSPIIKVEDIVAVKDVCVCAENAQFNEKTPEDISFSINQTNITEKENKLERTDVASCISSNHEDALKAPANGSVRRPFIPDREAAFIRFENPDVRTMEELPLLPAGTKPGFDNNGSYNIFLSSEAGIPYLNKLITSNRSYKLARGCGGFVRRVAYGYQTMVAVTLSHPTNDRRQLIAAINDLKQNGPREFRSAFVITDVDYLQE